MAAPVARMTSLRMTGLRRFAVVQLLLLWQGGFLFYAACVVPAGTRALGSAAAQGAVTARVTDALNVVGAVALAGWATRRGTPSVPRRGWGSWCRTGRSRRRSRSCA